METVLGGRSSSQRPRISAELEGEEGVQTQALIQWSLLTNSRPIFFWPNVTTSVRHNQVILADIALPCHRKIKTVIPTPSDFNTCNSEIAQVRPTGSKVA